MWYQVCDPRLYNTIGIGGCPLILLWFSNSLMANKLVRGHRTACKPTLGKWKNTSEANKKCNFKVQGSTTHVITTVCTCRASYTSSKSKFDKSKRERKQKKGKQKRNRRQEQKQECRQQYHYAVLHKKRIRKRQNSNEYTDWHKRR